MVEEQILEELPYDSENVRSEKSLDHRGVVFLQLNRISDLMTNKIYSPTDWRGAFRFANSILALYAVLTPARLSRLPPKEKKELEVRLADVEANLFKCGVPSSSVALYFSSLKLYKFLLEANQDMLSQVQMDELA